MDRGDCITSYANAVGNNKLNKKNGSQLKTFGGIAILNHGQFVARDVIYTSRAYAMMSVSVCL